MFLYICGKRREMKIFYHGEDVRLYCELYCEKGVWNIRRMQDDWDLYRLEIAINRYDMYDKRTSLNVMNVIRDAWDRCDKKGMIVRGYEINISKWTEYIIDILHIEIADEELPF